jgi:acetolactate synthase I/II/III large subunit
MVRQNATSIRTTGEAIVEGLVAHGVDTVFGIPGVQTYGLFDALAREPRINVIGARHEQTVAYMAFGYAQATGRPGVCSVVPGPGVLNASAALLSAHGASAPVVCLTSEIPSSQMGRGFGHLHEMPDQLASLRTFTKWAENIMHPTAAPGLVAEAFHQATSGRPRPVALAAPWDVLPASATVASCVPRAALAMSPDPVEIDRAAVLLAAAKNPMIMVGSGAQRAGAEVLALANTLQAPVVSFRGGRGVVSNEEPLGFTCADGFERWPETDVLIGIGSRLELSWLRWPSKPAGLKLILIDVDPEQHVRLAADVRLVSDAASTCAALTDAVSIQAPSRTAEFTALRAAKQSEISAKLQPHVNHLAAIRRALPRDGLFVEEISQVGFSSYFAFPVYEPRTFITCGHQGTLGFGFPTALGVKAAHPNRAVVSINGDGGFMFAAQELMTAVQYGLNVVTVVFNNNAYGNVMADQDRLFNGRTIGSELRNPDFVKFAESFGARGVRAHDSAELERAVRDGIDADLPTLIEVPMPLDAKASPWPFLMPAPR